MTLYTHQASNIRKTWLLIGIFLAIIVGLGYFLAWNYQMPEILYIAVAIAVIQGGTSYWFSDKVALSMSGAKPATREEFFDLWNMTENLAITAGLPMPRLYIISDPVPNAFATGRNAKHAAIAVTTGLLERLDRTELEGVIAHEMSHIGNRDILVMSVVVVLVGIITLVVDLFMRMTLWGGGRRNSDDRGSNAIVMAIGLIAIILSPIVAMIIQFSISRRREFLADASGALLTRYPEGLASALEKISQYSGEMKKANNAMAHMYIANPFGKNSKKGFGLTKLFMTHPPVEERIARLRNSL